MSRLWGIDGESQTNANIVLSHRHPRRCGVSYCCASKLSVMHARIPMEQVFEQWAMHPGCWIPRSNPVKLGPYTSDPSKRPLIGCPASYHAGNGNKRRGSLCSDESTEDACNIGCIDVVGADLRFGILPMGTLGYALVRARMGPRSNRIRGLGVLLGDGGIDRTHDQIHVV